MKKRIMKALVAGAMLATMVLPAMAADVSTAGTSGDTPVALTAEAARFSVTVPTQLPVSIDAFGVVTAATGAKIVNNGHGAVVVSNMVITGQNDWKFIDYDSANMTAEKVGAKKFAMMVNNDKTTGTNTNTFTASNFPKIDGKNDTQSDELPITYNMKAPAQATALTNVAVANVTFTVSWDS